MHISVLLEEIIKYLNPQANQNFIDCTLGGGGHSLAILGKILPNGKLLGIDCYSEAIGAFRQKIQDKEFISGEIGRIKNNVILVQDNFLNLKQIVEKNKFYFVKGILFDIGLSSDLLEKSGRGFSFLRDELLDMRFDLNNDFTAAEIVNRYKENDLIGILREYGEEKFARRIAQEIIKERKTQFIRTTKQLVEIIKKAVPLRLHHSKIHFATRVFQALRIETNDELNNLKKVLPQAVEILEPKGRVAVISFHSLEDRIVKRFFKERDDLKILTKKPLAPTMEEIEINPRSRSAKLRVAEKL